MITNKIIEAVDRLELDLSGKVVLTEAATGPYAVTPIIAALAGGEVYAYTRPTKYGSVEEVKKQTEGILSKFNKKKWAIEIVDALSPSLIANANIITNSGHLRPLNKEKLQYAKKSVVIPLMYESWEWRNEDLDINYCKEKKIEVGATNERHPDIDVFNYLGDMALKMIFDAGLCPYNNYYILMCNNDFGPFIAKVLSKVCKGLAVCDKIENQAKYSGLDIDWIGNFPEFNIPGKYKRSEAVLFTAYPFDKKWIGGDDMPIQSSRLMTELENPFILRYAGDIDEAACAKNILFYPELVPSGHMGILPSTIGIDPIIRLQSGGLKVAELMLKGETSYNGRLIVEAINV